MSRDVRARVVAVNTITNRMTIQLPDDEGLRHGDLVTVTIPEGQGCTGPGCNFDHWHIRRPDTYTRSADQ